MDPQEVVKVLRSIGFPIPVGASAKIRHEVVTDFQRGFAFWRLEPDGFAGVKTERALRYCKAHDGRISPNFRWREFASKGSTDYTIKLSRALVLGLEEYRDAVNHEVTIVSGYRDPQHNANVGGVGNSIHLYGGAGDVPPELSVTQVRKLNRFSGIGYDSPSGKVRHVDTRGIQGVPNTTGGTVAAPTTWAY